MPGVLDRCEKTLLEVLLMFVPFPDTGRGIFFSREWCLRAIISGYRIFIVVRAVFVVLLVDCLENVVNRVEILGSWTYYMQEMGVGWV